MSTKGGVTNVSPFITYPGILTNKEREMEGIILKGIDSEYDEALFASYIKKGSFPDFATEEASRGIFWLASRLL